MKRTYSKWCSVALIAAIYTLAGVAGWLLFEGLTVHPFTHSPLHPLIALLCADVLATIIVWAFGLLYENVSVYDPYWSVFPPVAFLLRAIVIVMALCTTSVRTAISGPPCLIIVWRPLPWSCTSIRVKWRWTSTSVAAVDRFAWCVRKFIVSCVIGFAV